MQEHEYMGGHNKNFGKAVVDPNNVTVGYIDDCGKVRKSPVFGSELVEGDNGGSLYVGGDGKIHERSPPSNNLGQVDGHFLRIRDGE